MKLPQRYMVVDRETGEAVDVDISPRRNKAGGDWMKVFQRGAREAAMNPRLHGQSYRVLQYLYSALAWGNKVPGTAKAAVALGLRQPNVSRAYKELLEAGLLIKEEDSFCLSPYVAWKGTEAALEARCRRLALPHLPPVQVLPAGTVPPTPGNGT